MHEQPVTALAGALLDEAGSASKSPQLDHHRNLEWDTD